MDIARLAGALALSTNETQRKQNEQYINEVNKSSSINKIKIYYKTLQKVLKLIKFTKIY
jgi:hypothetical protein